MIEPVLLDAGPLVAILHSRDVAHLRCVQQLRNLTRPPVTSWPVLTEAAYLVRNVPNAVAALFQMVESAEIIATELDRPAVARIRELLSQYASAGIQLADASLICLSERFKLDTVFTLDRRDFSIYRTSRGADLQIIPA